MRKQPFFSVVIPLYNRVHLIKRAVQSVLDQSFTDWELIIVDDCSTDGSWDLIQTFSDKRIRVFRNDFNSERCVTRNNGIKEAVGTYIAFLDSDDHHLPDHLEKLHQFIRSTTSSEKSFFFTNAWNESPIGIRNARVCPDLEDHDPYTYFLRYTVNPQRWAVHRDIMLEHQFDPNVNICEDMDTSLRILAAGIHIYQLKEMTTCYVAAEDSFTHGASDRWERELSNLEKIFARPELSGKLPKKETGRLKSMCLYHLACLNLEQGATGSFYSNALLSLYLCPKGYNGKTTWPLMIMAVYSIPVLGRLLRGLVRTVKNKE